MDKLWSVKNIAIGDLVLWDENARFPDKYFNSEESELIRFFLNNKDFKIRELAKEIASEFDIPQVERLTILSDDERNIVLEGNRRVTVYKLLADPDVSGDPSSVQYFQDLKDEYNLSINRDFELQAVVTNDIDNALLLLGRKHSKGNNEVPWGEFERRNFVTRRRSAEKKDITRVRLGEAVNKLDLTDRVKESILGKGYISNFYRITDSEPARQKLGYSISDDGEIAIVDLAKFNNLLKVIVWNIWRKSDFYGNPLNSRSLNTRSNIDSYLNSISEDDVIKVEEDQIELVKNSNPLFDTDIFGEGVQVMGSVGATSLSQPAKSSKSNPRSTLRSYLIPKGFVIKINEPKINNVFSELKNLLLIDDSSDAVPNAVGVLFRVFLEISIDFFLEKKGITPPPETKLAGKITKASDYMETNNIATSLQLKNIRTVATDKNNLLSIDTFHDYVHSYKTQPASSDLKLKWDNLQEFFEILWSNI